MVKNTELFPEATEALVSSDDIPPPTSCAPLHLSNIPDGTDISGYHAGLALLNLPATPQGELVAGLMEAVKDDGRPLYRRVAVQMARRSGKTTSWAAVALGRLSTRQDWRCAVTATTGKIARATWLEIVQALDQAFADMEPSDRPYHARMSNGDERLTWLATNSYIEPKPPTPIAFRSRAYDCIVLDEAGHIRAENAIQITSGILPTLDTRPSAQVLVAGTPGRAREGLLWDALEKGRAGRGGILEFAARETDDITDPATWFRVHPGLACGMTSLEVIQERFEDMQPDEFASEYCGRWSINSSVTAVDETRWLSAGTGTLDKPTRFSLAVDIEPDGSSGAIVAAWRDDEGRAQVRLIDARPGSGWIPAVLRDLHKRHNRPLIGLDAIGANMAVQEQLVKGRIPVSNPPFKSLQGACMTIVRDLEQGRLVHGDQPDLNASALHAVWRSRDGGRVFARKASKAPVSPLVAAAVALWVWDQQPVRRSGGALITA